MLALLPFINYTSLASAEDTQRIELPHTFAERREALLDSIGDGTAVLFSQGRKSDTGYRADGNFWYLTGVDEAGAALILSPNEANRHVRLPHQIILSL